MSLCTLQKTSVSICILF